MFKSKQKYKEIKERWNMKYEQNDIHMKDQRDILEIKI